MPLLCVAAVGVSCEKHVLINSDDNNSQWMQEPIDVILHIDNEQLPRMTKMQADNKTKTVVQNFGSYSVTHIAAPDYILVDQPNNTRVSTPPTEVEGEKNVNDLNVFFFYHHEVNTGETGELDGKLAHHKYTKIKLDIPGQQFKIPKVRVGKYDILVIANVGADMSLDKERFPNLTDVDVTGYRDLTHWQYNLPSPSSYNSKNDNGEHKFPMRYRSRDDVPKGIIIQHNVDGEEDFEINIKLKRLLAKVVFSYNCEAIINNPESGIENVTANAFGIINLPSICAPFENNGVAKDPKHIEKMQLRENPKTPKGGGTFYVPVNHAGDIKELLQKERTLANSPKSATYTSFTIKGTPTNSITRTTSIQSSTVDISYPLFLGNPAESLDGFFEDFNVQMGYNYNVTLAISGFNDDSRLVYTKILPLFNGDINPDGIVFSQEKVPGEITKVTEIVTETETGAENEYFVDVLIDARGANNQDFSTLAAVHNTGHTLTYYRIVELLQTPEGKWTQPRFISNDDLDVNKNPYPSQYYPTNYTSLLTYNGKLLTFDDKEKNMERAFRFYFEYRGDVTTENVLEYKFNVMNSQTLVTSEISGLINVINLK